MAPAQQGAREGTATSIVLCPRRHPSPAHQAPALAEPTRCWEGGCRAHPNPGPCFAQEPAMPICRSRLRAEPCASLLPENVQFGQCFFFSGIKYFSEKNSNAFRQFARGITSQEGIKMSMHARPPQPSAPSAMVTKAEVNRGKERSPFFPKIHHSCCSRWPGTSLVPGAAGIGHQAPTRALPPLYSPAATEAGVHGEPNVPATRVREGRCGWPCGQG